MAVSSDGASFTGLSVVERVRWIAESHVARKVRIHTHRHGNELRVWRCGARIPEDFPVGSMRLGVEQAPPPQGNPDALLFVFDAHGTGSDVRRWPGDPGASNGNETRRVAATPCGPVQRSRRRSTGFPGRNVGTGRPGNDSRHSGKDGRSVSSAQSADEGWIKTAPGATLTRLCESTVWGVASAVTVKSKLALRLSPRPACLTNFQISCHLIRVTIRRSNPVLAH